MSHTRTVRRVSGGLALLGLTLGSILLGGCGGSDDYYYGPPDGGFPHYRQFTIVLNVSDADGHALGGATVWVDGVAQAEKTSWDFVALGRGYPDSWRGFLANWIKGGYTVTLYDYYDKVDVTVMVSKTGYQTQSTTFHIDDSLPRDVFGRDTFIMERSAGPASAEPGTPVVKPQPGEVVGMEKGAAGGAATSK
jgi:hypothetical protein